MKRSLGVTLSAVAVGLGSSLMGLFALLMTWVVFQGSVPPTPGVPPVFMWFALFAAILVPLGLAAWGIATTVGLFKLRSWARWSMLAFSGLWAFFTLSSALVLLVVPIAVPPEGPPDTAIYVRIFLGIFYGLQAVLAGFWLYYFNRAGVRAQFGGGSAAGPGGRPLSISIIAWLLIFGGVSGIGMTMLPFPATLLGMVFSGWMARAFYLVYAVASFWVGLGLLRLRPASRIAGIVLFVHGMLNSLLFALLPGMQERLAALYAAFPGLVVPETTTATMVPSFLIGIVFSAIPIWFLVARRTAFEPQAPPPLPPAIDEASGA